MVTIAQFLIDNPIDNIIDEVSISPRFGKLMFKIKPMNGKEYAEYQKRSTNIGRHQKVDFSNQIFNELVVLNHTIEPNFRDAEVIKKAGCKSPEEFLYKSLKAGEIVELADKISAISGFDKDIEEVVDDAKNS